MFSALAILLLVGPSLQFTSFQQGELKQHNEYRALHGAPPLTLDAQLCAIAQNWANHLAKTGHNPSQDPHNPDTKNIYGENISWKQSDYPPATGETTKDWYEKEINNYNFNNPGYSGATGMIGHFTQVVWKSSTKFCIAKATKGRDTWIVANYSPIGNVMGQFPDNVLPKGRAFNQMMESLENPTVAEQKVREVFRQYDRDNNGRISADELIRYALEQGYNPTKKEIKKIRKAIRKYDTDGDGQINFEECLKAECYKAPVTSNQMMESLGNPTEAELQDMFNEVYPNGNDYVDNLELLSMKGRKLNKPLRNLRYPIIEDVECWMWAMLDDDGNNLVSLDELMRNIPYHSKVTKEEAKELRKIVRKYDTDGDGYLSYKECQKMEDSLP